MMVRRAILLIITIAAAIWSAALTFAGGIAFRAPWGRVSSRDPIRPLAFAVGAGLLFTFLDSRGRTLISGPRAPQTARRLAIVITGLTLLAGIRFGTFTAGGSDPSGYVSEAALWRDGQLGRDAPPWIRDAPWPRAEFTAAPLGYVPGPRSDTQVPVYPPGLPLLMAAAHAIVGDSGEYLVVPIAAAVLVWASFLLGVRLNEPGLPDRTHHDPGRLQAHGEWLGLTVAAMTVASPPFLTSLVLPMSDLPVTACWTVALVCALAGTMTGTVGAGAATALAITIRPNLTPLAAVVAAVIAMRTASRMKTVLAYTAVAAIGVIVVGVTNQLLYGSPLRSGYGDLNALYSPAFVWPNVRLYGSWFLATQTAIPLVGALAPLFVSDRQHRRVVVAVVIGIPAVTLALYLPYRPFDIWWYLRFLLPAYPPLFAGVAIVLARIVARSGRSDVARFGVAALTALLVLRGLDYSNTPTDFANSEPRYRHVAAAAATAPANAIFVAFQHSGSLRYYTGHDILRWDLIGADAIDGALNHLAAKGHALYWVGESDERETIQRQFRGTRFQSHVENGRRQVIDGVWLVDLSTAPLR